MKKYVLSIMLLTFAMSIALAQEEDYQVKETKTVLGKNTKARGFGSLDLKVSKFKNDHALLVGAHGGVLLDNRFILGLGGYGLTTNVDFEGTDPIGKQYLYGGYGGLVLGAVIAPREMVHIYIPVLIGAGGMEVTDQNYFQGRFDSNHFTESSAFFVVEPGIEVEINMTKFFKIGIGGSYRWIRESNLVNITDDDLSNFSGQISFKFGSFR